MNPSNPASATLVLLADMLERPLQTKYCSSCPVRKDVLAEALLDYAFFSRKARYVENAPPSVRPFSLSLSLAFAIRKKIAQYMIACYVSSVFKIVFCFYPRSLLRSVSLPFSALPPFLVSSFSLRAVSCPALLYFTPVPCV